MARPRKAEGAQGHRSHDLVVLPGTGREIPPAPRGLSLPVRKAWKVYWQSEVAQVARDPALPAIRRLFQLYDQYERATAILRDKMIVPGSMGQPRVNPVANYLVKLEPLILRLESELGITPMSMMRLGIAFGEVQMTAAELNRIAEKEPDDEALLREFEATD